MTFSYSVVFTSVIENQLYIPLISYLYVTRADVVKKQLYRSMDVLEPVVIAIKTDGDRQWNNKSLQYISVEE